MVDISEKKITRRVAVASAEIHLSADVFTALGKEGSPKGDPFETSRVAGIMAAKSTSSVIPMCHPINLNKVNISFGLDEQRSVVTVTTEIVSVGRTGVEMEALTSAAVTALTFYDMLKYKDKGMIISEIKLLKKSGGASGDFQR